MIPLRTLGAKTAMARITDYHNSSTFCPNQALLAVSIQFMQFSPFSRYPNKKGKDHLQRSLVSSIIANHSSLTDCKGFFF